MWGDAMSKKLPSQHDMNTISNAYREQYAMEVLNYDAVKSLMAEGASNGYDGVRIAQEKSLTLNETKAGKSLVKQLVKVGHKATWIDTSTGVEGFGGDHLKAIQYSELVIVWGSPRGSILHKVELSEES